MRWILLLLVAVAAWYGWKQYPQLVERRPSHEAVIENQSDGEIERIRLKVDGRTLARERLAAGERAALPFRVSQDASFELTWSMPGGERTWTGGLVPAGPMVQRHLFLIDAEGHIFYRAENK